MVVAPLVIDASVALSVVRGEPDGVAASEALGRWTREHRRLIVPGHFWLEVANAIGVRRRQPGSATLEAIHELDAFGFETIETDRPQLILIIDLIERYRLTAYDAAYLALAIAWEGHLVTFDAALGAAAAERRLPVGPHRLSEVSTTYEGVVTWPNYKGAATFLAKLRADAATPR